MDSDSLLFSIVKRSGPWRRLPAFQRHGQAALLVLATFVFWYSMSDMPSDARFIAFLPAVLASSLLFGRGPAVSATIMSATLVLYQFVAPVGSIIPVDTTMVAMIVFLGTSAFAVTLIEALRGTVDRLSATNTLLETIIESSPEPIGVKDARGRYVRANARMGRLLGTRKEAALGRRDRDFLPPEIATPLEVADATMISTGRTAMGEHAIGLSGQSPRCYLYSRAPWLGPDGDVLGIITIARDIEFLKQAERELRAADDRKSLLLHDINHRVKNSLASVAGLLELRRLEVDDQDAQNALSASIRQLVVLSHVFDRLHQSTSKESIRIGAFLEDLCDDLRRSVVGGHVMLDASIEDAVLTMDRAIALGLIVNELVANALKYAFPGDRAGKIVVRLQADRPSGLCLVVEDDGVGLSNDRPEGTGRALVGALARQLGGGVEWRQSRGTSALIRFPDAA